MGRRWFRLLMRLFPSDFRGDYGPDMVNAFDEELESRAGTTARARVWRRNVLDALRLGPRLHLEQLGQDARYALRSLWRSPAFALTAVAALAIGVGGTTVTFAVTDTFLFKPLPFDEPGRLVHVWADDRKRGVAQMRASLQEFDAWRSATDVLESAALFNYSSESITGGADPERVPSGRGSANLFAVLGARAEIGRTFLPGEDEPGAPRIVVLSHRFWMERYGGNASALGKTLELGGRQHEIVGVMPASFVFPLLTTAIWVPTIRDATLYTPDQTPFQVVARLAAGVSSRQAAESLTAASARVGARYPTLDGRGANVVPLRQALNFAYDILSIGAAVLGVANLLVLLAVSANISSLMLGRAVSRGREVAIRAAVGASRFRLIRQFGVESLLLALAGGAVGSVVAGMCLPFLNGLIPLELYRATPFSLDVRAIGVSMIVAFAASMTFGLVPALRFARVNLAGAMRQDGGTGSISRSSLKLQSTFVVNQVALTVVLLVGTLLVGRSVSALNSVSPGFNAQGVLSVQTILPASPYESLDAVRAFQDQAYTAVRAVPGVTSAAFVDYLPLNHERDERQFEVPGQTLPTGQRKPAASTLVVSADYFDVLRIRLESGRVFSVEDRAGRTPVAVINASMAARYWPGLSPVGRALSIEHINAPVTIVGVVADSLQVDLAEQGQPQLFLPQAQHPQRYLRLLTRTTGDSAAMAKAVSAAIHTVDARLPITEIQPLQAVVAEFLLPRRVLRAGLMVLGVFSLALGVFGIYGIVACFVSECTREIGIRAALGADRARIVRLVTGRGLRLAFGGAAVGLPLSLLLAYLLRGLLFGVGIGDPFTYGVVGGGIIVVAIIASAVPARRASRIDVVTAMKG